MTDDQHAHIHDAAIVGAGPAGLATALAMKRAGADVVCLGPRPDPDAPDRRTTALLQGSVRFLDEQLRLWERLAPLAAPLRSLRLIDRTGRLFRAPDTQFDASEIDAEAFGYNIPNADLIHVLLDDIGDAFTATQGVTALRTKPDRVTITLTEGGAVEARLAIGADGRNSLCRESASIGVRRWSYDQTAIVCNFRHDRPHGSACTEFHYAGGPFTVVPLPGQWASLVWVEHKHAAARLSALPDSAFMIEIARRLDGLLGDIVEIGPRGAFPLSALIAQRMTAERLALVGEAAHVMPPIGAQGLNLGFRDAADLVRYVAHAPDPGSTERLAAYERSRRLDVWTRTLAADVLNRTLTSSFPLFQLARGAGLSALTFAGSLRRAAMRQGMSAAR